MSLLRASVLGGVDGVITSFAIVASVGATSLSTRVVAIVGSASVLADGTSMGISEFLSSTAEASSSSQPSRLSAARLGIACLLSFIVSGCIPILVYITTTSLLSCAMFSLVELMILGALRTRFSGEALLHGVFQTTVLGAFAGGVAYAAARVADELLLTE